MLTSETTNEQIAEGTVKEAETIKNHEKDQKHSGSAPLSCAAVWLDPECKTMSIATTDLNHGDFLMDAIGPLADAQINIDQGFTMTMRNAASASLVISGEPKQLKTLYDRLRTRLLTENVRAWSETPSPIKRRRKMSKKTIKIIGPDRPGMAYDILSLCRKHNLHPYKVAIDTIDPDDFPKNAKLTHPSNRIAGTLDTEPIRIGIVHVTVEIPSESDFIGMMSELPETRDYHKWDVCIEEPGGQSYIHQKKCSQIHDSSLN